MEFFRNSHILIWFAVAACAVAVTLVFLRKKRETVLAAIGESPLLARLLPSETASRRALKTVLFLTALGLMFIAWAGPQWGVEFVTGEAQMAHAVIAVDTSYSMLARDLKPDRLENAKQMLSMLIGDMTGFRIGIVAFSGDAYIQCPITTDADALKYFVSVMKAGQLPKPGTDIASAITLSAKMLARYGGHKALILLTDGEDHGKDLDAAAQAAADADISIFPVGIGSPEGDLIPDGAQQYRKDKEGKTIVSKLGEKTLMELAARTGGTYVRYSTPEAVATALLKNFGGMDRGKLQSRARLNYKNRYQWPLFLAVLLLLLEMLIPERKITFAELAQSVKKRK